MSGQTWISLSKGSFASVVAYPVIFSLGDTSGTMRSISGIFGNQSSLKVSSPTPHFLFPFWGLKLTELCLPSSAKCWNERHCAATPAIHTFLVTTMWTKLSQITYAYKSDPYQDGQTCDFFGVIFVCVAYMYATCMHTCHSIHVVTGQLVRISLFVLHGFLGLDWDYHT